MARSQVGYTGPRFPLQPFLDYMARKTGVYLHPPGHVGTCPHCPDCCVSAVAILEFVGFGSPPTARRITRRGGLTIDEADQLATKAGLHPALIWDNWYRLTTPELEPAEATG